MKEVSIGQSRESIVIGQELDSFLSDFAVGDVAKVPDSSPIPAFRVNQRRGVSIENLPIFESELVPATFVPMAIEIFDPFDKSVGVLDSIGYVLAHNKIVSRVQQFLRYPKVEPKLFVRQDDLIGLIDSQHAINCRLRLRFQQRSLEQQRFLSLLALSNVVKSSDK